MKKFVKLFALFLMSVFCTSCGQNQTNSQKDSIKSETKVKVIIAGHAESHPDYRDKHE